MNRKDIIGKYNAETDNSTNKPHGSGMHFKYLIQDAIDKNVPLYKNREILKKLSGKNYIEDIPDGVIRATKEILAYIKGTDAE